MHGNPARHPHALARIEITRKLLGQARAAILHRQPDALPDALGRHVPGLLPGREHRVARRRQPLAGTPQFADFVHQRHLGLAGAQQVLQAQAGQLRVVLDVAVIAVEIFPVTARGEHAQPALAQGVAVRHLAVVLQEGMDFRGAGGCETATQILVIEIAAQHIAVEPLAQAAVMGEVAGLQGVLRRHVVAALLLLVAAGAGSDDKQRQQNEQGQGTDRQNHKGTSNNSKTPHPQINADRPGEMNADLNPVIDME
ncbi:MAG: hypothetical protein A2140_08865 [Candidatus Muproteobacteria bacterium RBG_16_62_13]|uniref:Uncharacterized protein n=1 Tax=Candidatus Muproteobacteria bacterium RBG_16_62_13 TaxID=1817756 RepID=A0A1F6T3R0_9PROT|nr:MAG: hypothetical protein A2140_08865 [Candidatus Muproteobacteria bacterium RBG_16_62_13]